MKLLNCFLNLPYSQMRAPLRVFLAISDQKSRKEMEHLLSHLEIQIIVLASVDTLQNALHQLNRLDGQVDLIFMDVKMKDGIYLDRDDSPALLPPIIFIAEEISHLKDALRVNCVDYLLNPISEMDLVKALNKFDRFQSYYQKYLNSKTKHFRKRFLVKQGRDWMSIDVRDIAWFSVDAKICVLKTWDNQRFLVNTSLEDLVDLLNPEEFFKANRNYIIHIKSIRSVSPYFGGKLVVNLQPTPGSDRVLVSKERAGKLKEWMGM